jgi:hypothetical protein
MLNIGVTITAMCLSVHALAGEWELQKETDGLSAYTKSVEGSDFVAVRVTGAVDRSVEDLIALNTDADRLDEWMVTFDKVAVVDRRAWFDYDLRVRYDFPFPFADRVSRTRSELFRIGDKVYLVFQSVPVEDAGGAVPMASVKGFWSFAPTSDGHTDVVYQTHIEPGGNMSSVLSNAFSIDVPLDTFRNLIARPEVRLNPEIDLLELQLGSSERVQW